MPFFLIIGLTSANKWLNRSSDTPKVSTEKKENHNDYFLIAFFFYLESGDLEKLIGTKKIWISKIQKLQPCKFNKHLLLKHVFEFRRSLRQVFLEKMLLEFYNPFNVIVKEYIISEAATGSVGYYKKAVLEKFAIFTGKHLCLSLFLIKFQGLQLY